MLGFMSGCGLSHDFAIQNNGCVGGEYCSNDAINHRSFGFLSRQSGHVLFRGFSGVTRSFFDVRAQHFYKVFDALHDLSTPGRR